MVTVATSTKLNRVFRLAAGTREQLAKLADDMLTSASSLLEELVTAAHDVVVRGQPPTDKVRVFTDRLRAYAAQDDHPAAEVVSCFYLGRGYVDGIRQLRDGLALPRMDLVVEYLIRAACDVPRDPPEGDDELARRRWAGSHNLHFRLFPQHAPQQSAPAAQQAHHDPGQLVPPEGNSEH